MSRVKYKHLGKVREGAGHFVFIYKINVSGRWPIHLYLHYSIHRSHLHGGGLSLHISWTNLFTFALAVALLKRARVGQRAFCLHLLTGCRIAWRQYRWYWGHWEAWRYRHPWAARTTTSRSQWRVGGAGCQNTAHSVRGDDRMREVEVEKMVLN